MKKRLTPPPPSQRGGTTPAAAGSTVAASSSSSRVSSRTASPIRPRTTTNQNSSSRHSSRTASPARSVGGAYRQFKTLPVPVSVTLRNLLPPTTTTAESSAKDGGRMGGGVLFPMMGRGRGVDPRELLVPVRLEVVASREVRRRQPAEEGSASAEGIGAEEEEEEEEVTRSLADGASNEAAAVATIRAADAVMRTPSQNCLDAANLGVTPVVTTPSLLDEEQVHDDGGGGRGGAKRVAANAWDEAASSRAADASALAAAPAAVDAANGVPPAEDAASTTEDEDDEEEEFVLEDAIVYESICDNGSVHPRWDHIDENVDLIRRIQVSNDENDDDGRSGRGKKKTTPAEAENAAAQWEEWDEAYQSMWVRISLLDRKKRPQQHPASFDAGAADDCDPSGGNCAPDGDDDERPPLLLAEIPLHPTNLRALPTNPTPPTTTYFFGTSHSQIPTSLPPNALLVQYSDGSTRVLPGLYKHLLSRKVIHPDPNKDEAVLADMLEENRRIRRFSDDAFAALDDDSIWGGPAGGAGDRGAEGGGHHRQQQQQGGGGGEASPLMVRSPSSLLGEPDPTFVRRALRSSKQNGGGVSGGGVSPPEVGGVSSSLSKGSFDDVFDLLGPPSSATDTEENGEPAAVENVEGRGSSSSLGKPGDSGGGGGGETMEGGEAHCEEEEGNVEAAPLPTESDVELSELRDEVGALEELLEAERMALSRQECDLRAEMEKVRSIIAQVEEKEIETRSIEKETEKQCKKLSKIEFLLEAQKVKMLTDVRDLYPIKPLSPTTSPRQRNRYTIRGIELPPTDILSNVNLVPPSKDEEVSAALGYLCHLVFLCGKYLGVPLRYRLVCNSSRSAVQDDSGRAGGGGGGGGGGGPRVYPLFKDRAVVDREQFDRGVWLLERNVECLLKMRGLSYVPRSHILAKMNRLFEQTIEGGE